VSLYRCWAAGWLFVPIVALATAGCLHRRGDWTSSSGGSPPASTSSRPEGVTLVLLGNAGWAGRGAATVADRLERVLEDADATRPKPIVLWLGNNVMARRRDDRKLDCADARRAWTRPGVDQLSTAVRDHLRRGHQSYAVSGEHDWRCGLAAEQRQDSASGPHPWRMPQTHYVVRVMDDGTSEVVSACDAAACELTAEDEDASHALIELVMIDATAWIHRETMREDVARENVAMLTHLLEALDSTPADSTPPRILVSHVPVEAAGWYGQGGGRPDSSWPFLPPALRRSLHQGTFVGVLAAHDQGIYADADLGDAVKRSDRVWLNAPLFQVVSGGASARATGLRRMRHFSSVTLLPDVYSPGLGFATLRIDHDLVEITLHARGAWRWHTSRLSFPLRRPPHSHETASPHMSPCLRCVDVPPNERP
jgi:hypothetical protein